jgi:hypothetical protein
VLVLVKPAEVGLGDSGGDRTSNKGERAVGGRDGDDAETDMDTIAVGVREGDEEKEEEEIIDGNSLKDLLSSVLSRLGSWRSVCEGGGPQDRDCTEDDL